jgi:hypothetical protein
LQGESFVMNASAPKITYLEVDNAEVHSAAECSFMNTLQRFTISEIHDKELGTRAGTFTLVRKILLTGKRRYKLFSILFDLFKAYPLQPEFKQLLSRYLLCTS